MAGRQSVRERIILKSVDRDSGCREWLGAKTAAGYGQIRLNRKCEYAHRVAWALENGPIPDGMEICHKCDNPSCVLASHLFCGTKSQNMRDMVSKGRCPDHRGEKSGKAKVNTNDVIEMGKMRTLGLSMADIAATYKIHPSHVSRILSGARWAHRKEGKVTW